MRFLIAESVGVSPSVANTARRQIELLKRALVESILEVHPTRRFAISGSRWDRCERFLQHFLGKRPPGRIFTTNYDLLLSWAVAPDRDRRKPDKLFRPPYEGFAGGPYQGCGAATIIYLHGALHLYAKGERLRQLQYRDTGIALHDQIAALMENGEYPLIVSEGASSLKVSRSPGFLRDALDAFKGTCRAPAKKVLFTLGHGLGQEDDHILKLIREGLIPAVYLGAYGRAEMDAFQRIAVTWQIARSNVGPPLEVCIFDCTDVVWGAPDV
ncbi:MAG: hypothetical protein JWM33_3232 [Caulobacteraceae bacterium]|nr:hypothetical protein [Caulobacteraceae bacterium]